MAIKSILDITKQVAAELNLPVPTVVLSSSDQNIQKLLNFARAVCDDLYVEYDWQQLQTRYSFSTVNGQEAYTLPSDIGRYISGTFFDNANRWPMVGPKTPTQWEWLKASNLLGAPFTQFRVYGDAIHLYPIPSTTTYTFNFEYISSYYVKDGSTGLPKADFLQDSDFSRFDHRLMVYGMKLKFRQSLGLDTTANLADFKRALEFAKGSDNPGQRLSLLGDRGFVRISPANYPDGSWG